MRYLMAALFFFSTGFLSAEDLSNKELGIKSLNEIAAQLNNEDSDIRMLSCDILGDIGNKAAIKILEGKLSDISKYVRISAAGALYKLGDKSGLKVLLGIINNAPGKKPIANTPLLEMKEISQNKIREKAIETLSDILGRKNNDLLFALKRDNYGLVRDAASRELAKLGDKDELMNFIYALDNDDEAIRYEAARSLGRICSANSTGALRNLLKIETSIRVRIAALDAMRCVKNKKIAEREILKLSLSKNPTIKFKATQVLSGIRGKAIKLKLKRIYDEAKDLGVKLAALNGLISLGGNSDTSLINSALNSKDEEIKLFAVDVLKKVKIGAAKPLLAKALSDSSYKVRLNAAEQIVKRLAVK